MPPAVNKILPFAACAVVLAPLPRQILRCAARALITHAATPRARRATSVFAAALLPHSAQARCRRCGAVRAQEDDHYALHNTRMPCHAASAAPRCSAPRARARYAITPAPFTFTIDDAAHARARDTRAPFCARVAARARMTDAV